jgi:hypothetical protein
LFFKAWQLIPWLKFSAFAANGLLLWAVFKLIASQWQSTLFSISVGVAMIALLGQLAALFMPALKWLNPGEESRSTVINVAIVLAGYCLDRQHLNIFDPIFLARGKLARLLNLDDK